MYSADQLKKEYEKKYREQRIKNLVKLRENVAGLSQTEFSKRIGIQKSNLSVIENGERDLSLFNIQAYIKYFAENHNINLSADYLLGYATSFENNTENLCNEIGLSEGSIWILKNIKNKNLSPELDKIPYVLDYLLQSEFSYGSLTSYSVLRDTYDYLFGKFKLISGCGYFAELVDETRNYKKKIFDSDFDSFALASLEKSLMFSKMYVDCHPDIFKYFGKNIPTEEMDIIQQINILEREIDELCGLAGESKKGTSDEIAQTYIKIKELDDKLSELRNSKLD